MKIKFLHLNMFKGIFLDRVIDFIKSEDIDIVNLQEVTGGILGSKNHQCFETIQKATGYKGELVKCWAIKNQTDTYFGNATFFKKEFELIKKDILWLKPYEEVEYSENLSYDKLPRTGLFLLIKREDKEFWVINTHLIRGENDQDTPLKLEYGKKLFDAVKKIDKPFILSGDFNVSSNSQIISWFNTLGINLTTKYNITNTLNPNIHIAKKLFPKGLAVDYIFVGNSLKVNRFERIDKDLSDHLGLLAEIEI